MRITITSIVLPTLFLSCCAFANNEASKTLKVKKLSENVYQHISYKRVEPWGLIGASGLVVVNGAEAHMVDTPWTTEGTRQLVQWIEAQGLTLSSAVVSHFHDDASGGIPLLNDLNIKTYATSLTNNLLKINEKEETSDEISSNVFEFIEGVASVFYPGAGHTEDNIVVWLPKEQILFGGCFVKNLKNKSLGYTGDANIVEWSKSMQSVIERYPDVKIVVPGHGEIGDASLLKHTQDLALSEKASNKALKQDK